MMDTFMENSYIPLYGITAVLSLYKYRKYFNTSLKYLPILFIYTFFNELLGELISEYELFSLFQKSLYITYNVIIYNIYNVIFYLYFYYIFWNSLVNEKQKRIIVYGGIIFLLIAVINPFFENFMIEAQTFTYVFGGIVLLLCTIFYFVQLRDPNRVFSINRDLLFWLSVGLFIFYSGYLPIKVDRYFNTIYDLRYLYLRKIHLSLIIIMYTCFIIGFVRMRRRLTT